MSNGFDDIFDPNEMASAGNYEEKLPCALVIDTSSSMKGKPIRDLNEGLRNFLEDTRAGRVERSKVEIALITFNGEAKEEHDFALVDHFQLPHLSAGGGTSIVKGVRKSMQMIESRKNFYKLQGMNYHRPYIILMTDGYPYRDSDEELSQLAQDIAQGAINKKFFFWAFGVEDADMDLLKKLSPDSNPPKYLKGTDFKSFFKWLSKSISNQFESNFDEEDANYGQGAFDEDDIFAEI